MKRYQLKALFEALEHANNNRTKAAEYLECSTRTIQNWIRELQDMGYVRPYRHNNNHRKDDIYVEPTNRYKEYYAKSTRNKQNV